MKKLFTLSLVAISVSLFGCGSGVPACNDSETKNLVVEIAKDELVRGAGQSIADNVDMEVMAVRTQYTDEQTGAHECAAELSMTSKSNDRVNEISITYTVEATDDGDNFYVNVFGL